MFEFVHLKHFCYHVALLFLLTATTKEGARAQPLGAPANDFTRHSVVQPIVHHGRSKRMITSTRDTAGEHHKQVSVTVNVDGEEYVLDLALNEHVVSRDHVISYQENGQTVQRRPTKEELDICQYSGTVRGKPGSWVAVSTCRGISGVIHDGHSLKYIEPTGEGVNGQHFLYDHADLKTTHATHKEDKNYAPENKVTSPPLLKRHPNEQILERASSRLKREAYNFDKRYVELMLVADNSLFKVEGESVDNVLSYFRTIVNIVNSMYAPFNIHISLENTKIWTEGDEIHIYTIPNITLMSLALYRGNKLLHEFTNNDHTHLITLQDFNDTVGIAFVGGICEKYKAVGLTRRESSVVGRVASTVAHELGHNLGMDHNKETCDCHGEHCIMNAHDSDEGINQTQWSDCNKKELAKAYKEGKDFCLRNLPGSQCGNGRLDYGESCDCGTAYNPYCAKCCDLRTCKGIKSLTCMLLAPWQYFVN